MKVSRPSSQILVLTESQLSNAAILALFLLFFAFWYYMLLEPEKIPDGARLFDYIIDRLYTEDFLWMFVMAPVFFLPHLFKLLRSAVMGGEELTFNGTTRTVLKNQKRLAGFEEINYLQLRTIRGADGSDHILTAILRTGSKIEIDISQNADDVIRLADDIADIRGVRVMRKD